MQREIIFRGQRVDNKEWVYGDLIHLEKDFKKIVIILHWTDDDNSSEVIPETVGQFTGIEDEKGNKIYEGDIIQYDSEEGKVKAKVVFNITNSGSLLLSGFHFSIISVTESEDDNSIPFLIIGNIHEP